MKSKNIVYSKHLFWQCYATVLRRFRSSSTTLRRSNNERVRSKSMAHAKFVYSLFIADWDVLEFVDLMLILINFYIN